LLSEDRSSCRIVYHERDVASWITTPPSVEEARPGRCPACGLAARPVGGRLGLHGHGLRDRQQRGPAAPGERAAIAVVALRRYLCVGCAAVTTVVPRDVEPRRHYSRPAIALALALWSMASLPPAEVRQRISPWRVRGATGAGGWFTLRRWACAARAGRLFRALGHVVGGSLRQVAASVATRALGHAPPSLRGEPREVQVFQGAVRLV